MSSNNNQIIVEALIKEQQEVLNSAKNKAEYLEELISKYKVPIITKSEAIPSIQNDIEELEVKKIAVPIINTKRAYTKRSSSTLTNAEQVVALKKTGIPVVYDDSESNYPKKILFIIAQQGNLGATNKMIAEYILSKQKGVAKTYDYILAKVEYTCKDMVAHGILQVNEVLGRRNVHTIVK